MIVNILSQPTSSHRIAKNAYLVKKNLYLFLLLGAVSNLLVEETGRFVPFLKPHEVYLAQ